MTALIPFPDIAPEIFSVSLFGMTFALRWYALAYIVGILLGWRIVLRAVRNASLWRKDTPPMTPQQVEDMLFWVILGVILGGRLGYVLFYQPAHYLANPAQILQVWQGGMSFHGGALGVIIAGFAYTQRHAIPKLPTADMICLGLAPACCWAALRTSSTPNFGAAQPICLGVSPSQPRLHNFVRRC